MEITENNNNQKSDRELEEIRKKGLSYFLESENTSSSRALIVSTNEKEDESDEINQIGCTFFLTATNEEPTECCISSYQLRWLTHHCKVETKANVQKAVLEQIQNEIGNNPETFKMKILLYFDPRKLKDKKENEDEINNEHIKKLLRCKGVQIRYKKSNEKQLLRISILKNYLFLSTSSKPNENGEVYSGVLYNAKDRNSPLLKFFQEKYNQDWDRAYELKLKSGKIVRADTLKVRIKKFWKSNHDNILVGVITTIITTIIMYIFKDKLNNVLNNINVLNGIF